MLSKKTQELLAKIVQNWDTIKTKHFPYKRETYSSGFESVIGHIWWNNPNLVWIFTTDREEYYGGSQSQIGVDKEGKLRWEYQSHCSCNDYEDTSDLPDEFTQDTLKSFDFTYTDPGEDWENQMQENMQELLNQ